MIWEAMRHTWSDLAALRTADVVPRAIEQLLESTNEDDARIAFELINNNVVVQGAILEAAPPTAACLVIALTCCSPIARINILELLNDLCGGNVSPQEEAEGYPLQHKCLQEIRKGFATYLYFLQYGTLPERRQCVDLLDMCAESDPSLAEQVVWHLGKLKELHLSSDIDALIDNTVKYRQEMLTGS
jgi:hypothetical protein